MPRYFASSSSGSTFTAAPTAGHPTIPIGTGTFAGGAAPDFQGTAALGVNMASGYASNLLDLQIAGVSQLAVGSGGGLTSTNFKADSGGNFGGHTLGDMTGSTPYLLLQSNTITVLNRNAGWVNLTIQGFASQTADLFQAADSVPVNHFGIANKGTGALPIWALRVAPVANAASMAQAHVGGASTGKAIQVIDNAGTTIGWLQLLA
jgi:hypothetical protein